MFFKGKHLWLASFAVPLGNIIVGIEIAVINSLPFDAAVIATLGIFLGEFVVVCLIGVPLFKWLMKNETFKELVLNI